MPNAHQVYQRVLQVGRAFLNQPEADDQQIASSLLELDEARFKIFTHQVGMTSTKHLRYTVLALACLEPPVGPLLRELLAAGASFVEVHKLLSLYKSEGVWGSYKTHPFQGWDTWTPPRPPLADIRLLSQPSN